MHLSRNFYNDLVTIHETNILIM